MNAPDIAGFVECYTDHPPLACGTQRHAVGDAGGDTFATWQFVQRDCQPGLEGSRDPDAAALGIEDEGVSGFREWRCRVEAGDTKRNLGAYARAAPCRFRWFFG